MVIQCSLEDPLGAVNTVSQPVQALYHIFPPAGGTGDIGRGVLDASSMLVSGDVDIFASTGFELTEHCYTRHNRLLTVVFR